MLALRDLASLPGLLFALDDPGDGNHDGAEGEKDN